MIRINIAEKMIKYLEERINCDNVMTYHDKYYDSILGKGNEARIDKLTIRKIPVAFKILKYNDEENYARVNKLDPKDRIWKKNLFDTFDFMTEANYTGHPYFPYLYGVLDCHDRSNSKIYTFYEIFDGNFIELMNKLEHASDWYDICFQMILINYYIEVVNGYRYNDGKPANHLFRKYSKPFYQKYELEGYNFNINHKYLIVLWDFNYMEKITDENRSIIVSNIDFLIRYLEKNKDSIKIYPSNRIIKMLNEIVANSKDSIKILNSYYTS